MAFDTSITLLTARTTTNSEPTASSDGFDLDGMAYPDELLVLVDSTAGSDTMTVTLRIWALHPVTTSWYPLGTGPSTTSGILNGGAAITENGVADNIGHAEVLQSVRGFSRLYCEVTAIGGTSTAITVVVATRDPGNR